MWCGRNLAIKVQAKAEAPSTGDVVAVGAKVCNLYVVKRVAEMMTGVLRPGSLGGQPPEQKRECSRDELVVGRAEIVIRAGIGDSSGAAVYRSMCREKSWRCRAWRMVCMVCGVRAPLSCCHFGIREGSVASM